MYRCYRLIKDSAGYSIKVKLSPNDIWHDFSPIFKTKEQAQKWYDTEVK